MNRPNRSVWMALAVICLVGALVAAWLLARGPMPSEGRTSHVDPASAEAPPFLGQALAGEPAGARPEDPKFARMRARMVEEDLRGPGRAIRSAKVLEVMAHVPRHEFVPESLRYRAYADHPLPIGHDQTISQPYIVALMTELVEPTAKGRALDVGTGSGYQAAVLAEICKEVYSIEIVKPLAEEARERLGSLGYKNVTVRHGDGYRGWPEKAPFDVIIVAAAPDHVPQPLVDQLAPGGKLVIPVGRSYQQLLVIERDQQGKVHRRPNIAVMFVPMTGEAQQLRQ